MGLGSDHCKHDVPADTCSECYREDMKIADTEIAARNARIAALEGQVEAARQRESFAAGNVGMHWAEERDAAVTRADAAESSLKERERERDTYKKYCDRLNAEMDALRSATDTARTLTNLSHNLDVQTKRVESAETELAAAREENERLRERYDVGRIEKLMNEYGAIPGDWNHFFDALQNGKEEE